MNHIYDIFKPKIIVKKVGYERIQRLTNNSILLNTLENINQDILIINTLVSSGEEDYINNLIQNRDYTKEIVIYGKNACDESVIKKYIQLKNYGFTNLLIYAGGLFEWLLLQDIYGDELFPTTNKTLDILKYKPIDN
tara:strand:- start:119 stop:529 length:411 start_codon:yes stop_codon:yes gene_type:complete